MGYADQVAEAEESAATCEKFDRLRPALERLRAARAQRDNAKSSYGAPARRTEVEHATTALLALWEEIRG